MEMWWPSPGAFESLEVTDTDDGFELSAPDDSELGEWLAFWSQDEQHHTYFESVFIKILTDYANLVLEQHGKDEVLPNGSQSDSEQAEDVGTRLLS